MDMVKNKLRPLAVASHRRSGTHLLLENLAANLQGAELKKSHDFPERLIGEHGNECDIAFVVRNPFDTLFSLWRWWETGKSSNMRIKKELQAFTFADFIEGKCGPLFGFRPYHFMGRDHLECWRGMFYDPIQFWNDHTQAFLETGCAVVSYEHLRNNPREAVAHICKRYGLDRARTFNPVTAKVGHAPTVSNVGYSLGLFQDAGVARVLDVCGNLMMRLGYQVEDRSLAFKLEPIQ